MRTIGSILIATIMSITLSTLYSCRGKAADAEQTATDGMPWIVDRFDDIKVLRYEVTRIRELPLEQKKLIYYLAEATKCGRDILFDQNFKYNLAVRHALENIYTKYDGDRDDADFKAMEKYLKKVWFANGIHHHYSNDKFRPEFKREWFENMIGKYVDINEMPITAELLCDIVFIPRSTPPASTRPTATTWWPRRPATITRT